MVDGKLTLPGYVIMVMTMLFGQNVCSNDGISLYDCSQNPQTERLERYHKNNTMCV